jgi:hypothetical protein
VVQVESASLAIHVLTSAASVNNIARCSEATCVAPRMPRPAAHHHPNPNVHEAKHATCLNVRNTFYRFARE